MNDTYFLVDSGQGMPRWCVMIGGTGEPVFYLDAKHRKIPYEVGKVLAHVTGESIYCTLNDVSDTVADLESDLAYQHLLDPWSDQGWIAPNGRFYGCGFYQHDDLAHALLRKSVPRLEDEGWVRVHESSFRRGETFRKITGRQTKTLSALGFPDPDNPVLREKVIIDRNAPPPPYAETCPERLRQILTIPSETPREYEGIKAVADRLRNMDELSHLFERPPELIGVVGEGDWEWMLRFDDIDIGCAEPMDSFLEARGLHFRKTSFNTIEVGEWFEDGCHYDPGAMDLIASQKRQRTFAP